MKGYRRHENITVYVECKKFILKGKNYNHKITAFAKNYFRIELGYVQKDILDKMHKIFTDFLRRKTPK